jgi:transcription elongation factor Elf1
MVCFKCGHKIEVKNTVNKKGILYFKCSHCGAKHSVHKKDYDRKIKEFKEVKNGK